MDHLELHMRQCRLEQCRSPYGLVVEESLEGAHAVLDVGLRRWHETSIPGASAANPVLAAPELTRGFALAASSIEQQRVHLANQSIAQRHAATDARETMLHGRDIVGDFHDIIERYARSLVELEQHEVG